MVVRLCAVAFLAIGCLLVEGSGIALAGDPASSEDTYSGQSGEPASEPDSMDQLDPVDNGDAAQAMDLLAEEQCSGHQLLPARRPEASCQCVVPRIFVSPDKALRASIYPADVSLDATPDMESRVVIRSSAGDTLTSKDYSSPRGMNGYYVYNAKWSPDSQFFVYSMTSSGGHSPWSFPIMVYGRKSSLIANFSDMIDGKPTLSGEFEFAGPHTVTATTWRQPGSLDDTVPITVDLERAFAKLAPSKGAQGMPGALGLLPWQQEALDAHNTHRSKHCVPPLTWDAGLAAGAQKWADRCVFEAESPSGENIYLGSGEEASAQAAVNWWHGEIRNYNFSDPGPEPWLKTGHFTQVVWRDTKRLGCGMATCPNPIGERGDQLGALYVCRYSPRSPMSLGSTADYQQNVLPLCQ